MMFLRQSTAATIVLGPFVDSGDGVTPETSLTISQSDVRLSKNGGAFAQKNDSNAATHMENGYYSCALDTTDTGTLGRLRVAANESGALLVWQDFMVIPAEVYDSLIAGSDNLTVDLTGAAVNAVDSIVDAAEAAIRGGGETLSSLYSLTENLEQDAHFAATTLLDLTEFDGGTWRFTANALEEAPTGGLDAAGIRAAIGLSTANLDTQLSTIDGVADDIKAVTEKLNDTLEDSGGGDYIFTEAALAQAPAGGSGLDAEGVRAAVGLASANLDTQLSTIDNNVDAILADTDELQGDWEDGGRLDLLLDGVKAKTDNLPSDPADQSAVEAAITSATSGLATATALSTVDNVVDAIQTVTDKLDDTLELDGEVYRFTENALEEAPTGSSSGLDAAGVRAAIGLAEANLDTQLSTIDGNVDDILADTDEVQATLAAMTEDDSGTPRFTENALEEAPSGGLDAAGIRTAVGLASANLDTQLGDLPTNSELAAALASADDAVLSAIGGLNDLDSTAVQSAAAAALVAYDPPTKAELDSAVSTIRGADSDTLKSLSDQIDDLPTATEIRSEIDDNSTKLAAIVADTNELQTDWANGGRLDNILDSRAAQSDLASVLEDTDELQTDWANGGRLDLLLDAKSTQDSVDALALAVAAVQAVAEAIQAKTDNLPEQPAAVGSEMNLADDAITRAKFDESTAHPLRSADTGASAVARAGSGSPTLETLAGLIANVQADLDDPDQFKADVSGLATSAALTSVANNVASILAQTGSNGVALSAATLLLIADAVLRRGVAHTEEAADEGSLTELILGAFESAADNATWTIRKTDGSTFNTRDLTLDSSALPVVGVD